MNFDSCVGSRPTVICSCLTELFLMLDNEHVNWAVMRGWERLPEWTRYDIDILVNKGDGERAVEVVKVAAARTGWVVYGVLKLGLMRSVWMLLDEDSGQSYLRIDIETGNAYRGIEIHESQKYLQSRIRERGLWRMPDGYAGACVLLKQIAVDGCVDAERRREQVLNGLADPVFREIVADALQDESLTNELIAALRGADWDEVKKLGRAVKKRLFRIAPCRIASMFMYSIATLRSMFVPYMRLFVVIVGPDGCGKTTVADALEDRFKGRPFQGVCRIHMLFGVPRLRSMKALACRLVGKKLPDEKKETPGAFHCGMQPPHSRLRAMMYVTYYGLGMICGRIKLMLWRPQGGLVIADRFFQDYYYMRGYMRCPRWYVRLFETLAPRPDFIVSLERPAKEIYAQKPELDIEEIRREQNVIRECFGGRSYTRIVDAARGVDRTIDTVVRLIEDWLAAQKVR